MWIFDKFLVDPSIDVEVAARIEANRFDGVISFDEEKNDDDETIFNDLMIYLEPNKIHEKQNAKYISPSISNFIQNSH